MKMLRSLLQRVLQQPGLNFVLTNWLPRRRLTLLMSRISRIEQPFIRNLSIAAWRTFSDVDLTDARKTTFSSLHDCFIRELRDGARAIDMRPQIVASPCDAIVGQCGALQSGQALQAKGRTYPLSELLGDEALGAEFSGGNYATLRLTAGMYHRFHAPHDCTVTQASYIGGDAWNVNPPALSRVDYLYCRNERAVVRLRLRCGTTMLLVPVAAILVASIRLHAIPDVLNLRHRGHRKFDCDSDYIKGQEMGWFEHGSTIIAITPLTITLAPGISPGHRIRMGEALFGFADSR